MKKSSFLQNNNKVSVVIPSWNGKHLLKICLQSLKKQTLKKFEIIVVDNGSNDGSADYVSKFYPAVKLIQLDKNKGFSFAVNEGIKVSGAEYIVLLNNDTRVDHKCLEQFVLAAQKHEEAGMVAAKMLNYENPSLIDSAGNFVDSVGHANSIGFGEKDRVKFNKAGYVFLINGGGCLIKREVFESIGLFDEKFFLYMEDIDLSFRAQMVGFKAWYEPKAVIFHKHKATSSSNKPLMEYFLFRNMMQTIIKDFPKELLLKDLNWLKIILVNLNTIIYLWNHGNLMSALKAEWFVVTNMQKLLKQRRQIQSNIKVDINYIIENIRLKKFFK